MTPPPPKMRHAFRPLLFSPPQGGSALPKTLPPPPRVPGPPRSSGTTPVAPPAPRGSGESHTRLRALPADARLAGDITWLDANELLDELGDEHLNLSVGLAGLERAIEQAPRDPSARAALLVLEARVRDLGRVRDALSAFHAEAVDRRMHRVLLTDAPLADYLRGIYAWLHAVLRALDQLALALRTLQPDWALLRYRLEEAKLFHFEELVPAVQADLVALALVCPGGSTAFERAVDDVIASACVLESRLDERFG